MKSVKLEKNVMYLKYAVNSEIFARILFSRIALKHIFSTLNSRQGAWITYISKLQCDFSNSWGFFAYAKFRENKTLAKISEFTVTDLLTMNSE